MNNDIMNQLKGGLIVSCQALPDEPLHSPFIMGRMALAAKQGGAVGIRANTQADIREIKKQVELPVIGIVKRNYPDSDIFITSTMREIDELVEADAELIALDATDRIRPNGLTLEQFLRQIRAKYPQVQLMADISTAEEAKRAEQLGFDCISTTLVGYTPYTAGQKVYENDFSLLRRIVQNASIPVFAEGNILTPDMARRCLDLGAHAIVVGGAITRPQVITERFVQAIKG